MDGQQPARLLANDKTPSHLHTICISISNRHIDIVLPNRYPTRTVHQRGLRRVDTIFVLFSCFDTILSQNWCPSRKMRLFDTNGRFLHERSAFFGPFYSGTDGAVGD